MTAGFDHPQRGHALMPGIGHIGTWCWHAQDDGFEEQGLWQELLGHGQDARLRHSRDLLHYVHPDDIPRMLAAKHACLKRETQEYELEHRLRAADGRYVWVLSRGRVTARDRAGHALVMDGVYLDLTRFNAIEKALRAPGAFLRLVLDTSPVHVFCKDRESRRLDCSRADAEDAGLASTTATVGRVDEDPPRTVNAELNRADDREIMGGDRKPRLHLQRPVTAAQRSQRWLATLKVPLRDAAGEVIGVLGNFTDITERCQKLCELTTLAAAFANGSGSRLLQALAQAAVDLGGARSAFVARVDSKSGDAVLVAAHPPELRTRMPSYTLAGTPCAETLVEESCVIASGAAARFPGDAMLAEFGIEGYAGRVLHDAAGQPIGLLVILGDQPFREPATLRAVLEILAVGAAFELAREQRERELSAQRQQLDIAIASGRQGFWDWDLARGAPAGLAVSPVGDEPGALGIGAWSALAAGERRALRRALVSYLRGRVPLFKHEVRVTCAAGVLRWILLRGKTVERDEQGRPRRLMGTHTDITSMKATEIALEDARRFLATVLDTMPQAVFWKDAQSRYLGCNTRFAQLAGVADPAAIVGCTDEQLRWPHLAARLRAEDASILDGSRAVIHTEDTVRNARGETLWVEKFKVPFFGPDNRIVGVLGTTQDITTRKRSEDEIERLAFFDPLTGLPNRRYFKDRLGATLALAQRRESAGALLYLDLDHFKKINDTLGHSCGDRLLVEASARIKRLLRRKDMAARLGGDEFVILLGDLSLDTQQCAQQSRALAARLREALSQPFRIDGDDLYVTSTIGIAIFPEHHDNTEELLKMADAAMYRGKLAGRNTVFFFDPGLLAEAEARLQLETLLRGAIDRHEIFLHYQPQVDAMGQLVGAEALMRWHHPALGVVSPARFIPIAEESGLIDELGMWVIRTALAALARWQAQGVPMGDHLAVNVSQRQFTSPRFVEEVLAALRESPARPGSLVLELTETAAAERVEDTIAKMELLRAAGVSFSIDDFGVGYSSLSYLAQLPLQQLKIDRSFITNVEHDRTRRAIVASLLTLGENLGLRVVAEGIETSAQWARLIERGCRAFQGYLFSRPLPEADFIAFCRASDERAEALLPELLREIA